MAPIVGFADSHFWPTSKVRSTSPEPRLYALYLWPDQSAESLADICSHAIRWMVVLETATGLRRERPDRTAVLNASDRVARSHHGSPRSHPWAATDLQAASPVGQLGWWCSPSRRISTQTGLNILLARWRLFPCSMLGASAGLTADAARLLEGTDHRSHSTPATWWTVRSHGAWSLPGSECCSWTRNRVRSPFAAQRCRGHPKAPSADVLWGQMFRAPPL